MMRGRSSVGILLVWATCAGACGGGDDPPHRDAADEGDVAADRDSAADEQNADLGSNPDGGGDAPIPGGYSLPEFPGGFSFYLRLPPAFSPFLPLSGDEATREPPGFYEPTSPNYFSYGFIWWLNGEPDLSTAALRADLRDYYTGLCKTTVAVTLGEPSSATDAGVLVGRREGTLEAGACFGNPVALAAIEVSTYSCPDHPAVIVLVSPQPATHQVWTELRSIRDGFRCW